ncbi:hypothetical protein [Actinoplanes nipponensis]
MGVTRPGNDLTGAVMDALRWSTQTVTAAYGEGHRRPGAQFATTR